MRVHIGGMALALAALVALAGCARHAPTPAQRVAIQVTDKGFEPRIVTVKAGQPVTLVVTRITDQTCATELVMNDGAIHRDLPLGRPVEITFTPKQPGDVTYACGMDMYHGTIRVQ